MKIKLQPGTALLDGQYVLEEKLGEGGMASVWAAQRHPDSPPPHEVVLKILLHEVRKDDERRRMFLEEARLSIHLRHPYIVQIFSVEHWQNIDFLVMERLWGCSLDILLQQNNPPQPVPWPYAVKMMSMVAQALHYANQEAHIQGQLLHLIHRDLKPANLLLTAEGSLKVIDFGVAKASTSQIHTRTGLVKGTVAYMSPEQLHADPLDIRSDLHSVGAVLYQICCGERPFLGESVTSVILKILNEIPPSLMQKIPNIPISLSRLVDKLLSKDRIDRPADALMLYQQLEDILAEEKTSVSSTDLQHYFCQYFPEIHQEWQRRHAAHAVGSPPPGVTLLDEKAFTPPVLQWNPIRTDGDKPRAESESEDTLSQSSFPTPVLTSTAPPQPPSVPSVLSSLREKVQDQLAQLPFSPAMRFYDAPEDLPPTEPSAPAGSLFSVEDLDADDQTVRHIHPASSLHSRAAVVPLSPASISVEDTVTRHTPSASAGSEDTLTAPPEKTDPSQTHPDEADIPLTLSRLREVLQQLPAESAVWLESIPTPEPSTLPSGSSAHESVVSSQSVVSHLQGVAISQGHTLHAVSSSEHTSHGAFSQEQTLHIPPPAKLSTSLWPRVLFSLLGIVVVVVLVWFLWWR